MNQKFICIKDFEVPRYDDDGFFLENEYFSVAAGTEWWLSCESMIGGEIRLKNSNGWIEIDLQKFKECFKEVQNETN